MYNQDYIKEKIDENNKIIESLMTPNTIAKLLKENSDLQKHCKHQFDNGYCIYCYKEKEE